MNLFKTTRKTEVLERWIDWSMLGYVCLYLWCARSRALYRVSVRRGMHCSRGKDVKIPAEPSGRAGWDHFSLEWSQALNAAHPNTGWDDFSGSLRCQGILSNQSNSVRLYLNGAGFCPEVAHCHACVSGFYGQLQTFCPPHYPDSQRTLPPSTSCSMVPAFEDCLVPTSMGQTGFDVFHRAFSTHSGITGGCLWLDQHKKKPGAFPVAARDSVEFSRTTPEITSCLHLLPWLLPLCVPAQRPAFLPEAVAVPSSVPPTSPSHLYHSTHLALLTNPIDKLWHFVARGS